MPLHHLTLRPSEHYPPFLFLEPPVCNATPHAYLTLRYCPHALPSCLPSRRTTQGSYLTDPRRTPSRPSYSIPATLTSAATPLIHAPISRRAHAVHQEQRLRTRQELLAALPCQPSLFPPPLLPPPPPPRHCPDAHTNSKRTERKTTHKLNVMYPSRSSSYRRNTSVMRRSAMHACTNTSNDSVPRRRTS